jgi:hypothetical protein
MYYKEGNNAHPDNLVRVPVDSRREQLQRSQGDVDWRRLTRTVRCRAYVRRHTSSITWTSRRENRQ